MKDENSYDRQSESCEGVSELTDSVGKPEPVKVPVAPEIAREFELHQALLVSWWLGVGLY